MGGYIVRDYLLVAICYFIGAQSQAWFARGSNGGMLSLARCSTESTGISTRGRLLFNFGAQGGPKMAQKPGAS